MRRKQQNSIGKREWIVMRHVSDNFPVGVREVAEYMAAEHGLARTSVLTVMERLREKGFLKRRKQDGRWMYSPAEEKSQILRGFVQEFYEHTLQGVLSPFVAFLSEDTEVSDEQLDELKELVKNLEDKRKSPARNQSRKRGKV